MTIADVELGAADTINDSIKFLLNFKEEGQNLGNQVPPSIYMVPSQYRDLSPSSYNPRVVSIGPLHRKDPNLQGFESQKATYFHHLLDRFDSQAEQTLKECLHQVSCLIREIKACYVGSTTYNDVDLARMMVIDGCFILDFIHRLSEYDETLWKNMLITQPIIYDLLLIENQIPFFVLEHIFECTYLKLYPDASLNELIQVLLPYYNIFGSELEIRNESPDHILGLVHKSYQPAQHISLPFESIPKGHSAVDLDRAGVTFRPNKDKDWPLSMKLEVPKFSCFPWLWCKPTLSIPVMCIDDFTELVLRNLIIYEQSSLLPNYVTSYACSMDMLIDTPEDVARLIKSELLVNDLGSNEKAADMINNITKEIPIVDFFYYQTWNEMDTYYNGYWPTITAEIRRTYFSSPWTIIALFAGVVLFILTVVQTIFTIKPR